MKNFIKIFTVLLTFISCLCFGNEKKYEDSSGTLIVTYQTGIRGEYLDRIRFLIKNDQFQQQMYPKDAAYVEDELCQSRMVVIESLPKGEYTIEFVYPNSDNLFQEAPIRKFTITKDEVVKIDQEIFPRYAELQVSVQSSSENDPLSSLPMITLVDDAAQIPSQSAQGKLQASYLLPGSYTVSFQEIADYETPLPIMVTLSASEKSKQIGVYKSLRSTSLVPR